MRVAKDGNVEAVEALLRKGANPNRIADEFGENVNAVMIAMNQLSYNRLNHQHEAQSPRYLQTIKLLLKSPTINVNLRAKRNGYTPLMYAVRMAMPDVVQLLLNAGADPNSTAYGQQFSVLSLAISKALDPMNADGNKVFDLLLRDPRLNMNKSTRYLGNTALTEAVSIGATDVVRRLLAAGANPNSVDASGDAPIIAATQAAILNPNHDQMVSTLRLLTETKDIDLKITLKGKTALAMAQAAGRRDLIEILDK
jgi:ankyrin repeat protein